MGTSLPSVGHRRIHGRGRESMLLIISVATSIGWLLALFACMTAARSPRPRVGRAAVHAGATPPGMDEPPAVVSLLAGNLDAYGYPATLLDLAARGWLRLTRPEGGGAGAGGRRGGRGGRGGRCGELRARPGDVRDRRQSTPRPADGIRAAGIPAGLGPRRGPRRRPGPGPGRRFRWPGERKPEVRPGQVHGRVHLRGQGRFPAAGPVAP